MYVTDDVKTEITASLRSFSKVAIRAVVFTRKLLQVESYLTEASNLKIFTGSVILDEDLTL